MSQRQQSKTDKNDWQTPDRVLGPIQRTDPITTDPSAAPDTSIGEINITEDVDGLTTPWDGVVFMNPEFGNKGEWIERAIEQYENNRCVERVYILTPDSTDVKSWWHGKLRPKCTWTVFFEGRVKYIDPATGKQEKSPPGGAALSILGDPPNETLRALSEVGDVMKRPRFLD